MKDEFSELLETAMYKEVASQAFYIAAQQKTDDPGAKELMKELADQELRHLRMLEAMRQRDWKSGQWRREVVSDLRISEYLVEVDKLEDSSLQDTLVFAMKREQHAVEFYSRMMSALRSEDAKLLCERLVHEELKHKYRLELLYDSLFLRED